MANVEIYTWSTCPRTVPQIFINDQHIGGSDDLYELERRGELDMLLSQTPTLTI